MKSKVKKEGKIKKGFVYWFPRIGGLIFALFLMLFSFDVFELATGFWQTLFAFLMHSIPSIILLIITWISWKREIIGAIVFGLFAIAYMISAIFRAPSPFIGLSWSLIIALPTLVIAFCFWKCWKRK